MRTWANVAELSKTKTLTGGLVARCAPGLPFLLEEGMEVAFVPPRHDAPRRARVLSVQDAGRDAFLVTFEGVDSIDVAELLVGCSCLVRRADLPESALAAEADGLEGFEVHDAPTGAGPCSCRLWTRWSSVWTRTRAASTSTCRTACWTCSGPRPAPARTRKDRP